jgi:hypothetical protein
MKLDNGTPHLDPLPSTWPERLAVADLLLTEISSATETEFLTTGAELQSFFDRADLISQMSSEMVGKVSGAAVSSNIAPLHGILQQMEEYLKHEESETERIARDLRVMLVLPAKIAVSLVAFNRICQSMKLEGDGAGQNQAKCVPFAGDVQRLSVHFQKTAATILDSRQQVSAVVDQTLQVLQLAVEQRQQAQGILEKTQASLASLGEVNHCCSTAASAISTASDALSGRIAEVVMSMQFHDIVRQQIEHVAWALDDLRGSLAGGFSGYDTAPALAQKAALTCRLQVAQLNHAREELVAAVLRIVDNLRGIAAQEERLAEDTSVMAGVADQTGSSFLTGLGKDLVAFGAVLDESSRMNEKLIAATNQVAQAVQKIVDHVSHLKNVSNELEQLARHARLEASTAKNTMERDTFAEAVQLLADEAVTQTSAVSAVLTEITRTAGSLCSRTRSDASELDREVEGMVKSLPSLHRSLQGINYSLTCCLEKMHMAVQSLRNDINSATGAITAHYQVTQVVDQVNDELCAIIDEAQMIAPQGSVEECSLLYLTERYTMESERRIHCSIVRRDKGKLKETAMAASVVVAAMPLSDALEDNVELF